MWRALFDRGDIASIKKIEKKREEKTVDSFLKGAASEHFALFHAEFATSFFPLAARQFALQKQLLYFFWAHFWHMHQLQRLEHQNAGT